MYGKKGRILLVLSASIQEALYERMEKAVSYAYASPAGYEGLCG
jgi:hypothetical protein